MSASALFTRIMANVRARMPGAVDVPLQYELFNVLDEFFQGSDIWRQDITVPVIANQTAYEVDPDDTGAAILRLIALVDANNMSVPATMGEVGVLVLNTVPVSPATLTATVSLTIDEPTRSDGYPICPDWILLKYRMRLEDGLLSRMMSQPAKPYSNEKLAIYHGQRFMAGIARANVEGRTANLYGGQAWRFPAGGM